MPDSHESISHRPSPKLSSPAGTWSAQQPAALTGADSGSTHAGALGVGEARSALRAAAADLEAVYRRLSALAERLPVPCERFLTLAELRAAIDCVRADLLTDAIETLEAAATLSERELRRRFAERRSLLIL